MGDSRASRGDGERGMRGRMWKGRLDTLRGGVPVHFGGGNPQR